LVSNFFPSFPFQLEKEDLARQFELSQTASIGGGLFVLVSKRKLILYLVALQATNYVGKVRLRCSPLDLASSKHCSW